MQSKYDRQKRNEEIKAKGFNMINKEEPYAPQNNPSTDFSKVKVGLKSLDDAVLTLNDYEEIDSRLGDKKEILRALYNNDYETLRDASNFFYKTSGIYSRLCRYMAYLYRYDWFLTPYIVDKNMKEDKILKGFNQALVCLDNFEVKKVFGEIALKVIRFGCYYGYTIRNGSRVDIQELPPNYCRSRFSINNRPTVEFNMKYFDDAFKDSNQKMRMLGLFPKEFKKGYILYKEGKLKPEFMGDKSGWYLLDTDAAFKFNLNGEDFPAFVSVIPSIIDLNEAQALDRKKMAQQLLKIIIQKMPIDKNGDLVFDIDEAQQLHNNVVAMLSKAIGIDVLTTFADVEVEDMADKNSATTRDELEKVERGVYNESGIAQNLFNTDGNLALEKSILNDEASMYTLLTQFESFLNDLIEPFNTNPKKVYYKVQILTTTIYNYKELSKLYKEQTQMGYSKMLPQIALGQSQSSVLANAYFENEVLELFNVFIPPLMSSTMNADAIDKQGGNKNGDTNKTAGRDEKPDDEKSDKTLKNRESMN